MIKDINKLQDKKTQCITSFSNKEKIHQEEIINIISNKNYINWLIDFTQKNESFSDCTWLYINENLKEIDIINIKKLNLFYDGIRNYAEKNYIYPIYDGQFSCYYAIKINNIGFKIGMNQSQSIIMYCQKTDELDDTFIDFNDIMLNRKQSNVDNINKLLRNVEKAIILAYQNKVPIEAIEKTTNQVINELIWKSKDKNKILKKDKSINF